MYIVFEGIDDSGKSTQIELVRERLQLMLKQRGKDFVDIVTVAEPELGEVVNRDDSVELALRFALQRRLLLNEYPSDIFLDINPTIVLSDRSYYSSLAYQNTTLVSLPENYVWNVNAFAYKPSMIFFFDGGDGDTEYLRKVRNEYFNVLPLSTIYVDTKNHSISQTTEYICRQILSKWEKRLETQL